MRKLHWPTVWSVAICGVLILVGAVRLMSYLRETGLAEPLRESLVGWLAYRPDSAWSVRVFKIVSTPVFVAVIYFVFRALNRLHRVDLPGYTGPQRTIDFSSAKLRLVLTTIVTLHWVPLEYAKFTSQEFYPDSPLENVWINVVVLLASQAIAFVGMRYLSFGPLTVRPRRAGDPPPD